MLRAQLLTQLHQLGIERVVLTVGHKGSILENAINVRVIPARALIRQRMTTTPPILILSVIGSPFLR